MTMADQINIKKRYEEINHQHRELNKAGEENQTRCTHTRAGNLTLISARGKGNNGELVYVCKKCGKEVRLTALDDATVSNALKVVDQMIDSIKMSANENNEHDAEMIKKLAKVQYITRNKLATYYKASTTKNNRHGGKRNDSNYNGGDSWEKARII